MLVMPQNCAKMLRNLTFVVLLHQTKIIKEESIKHFCCCCCCCFGAAVEQLSLQKANLIFFFFLATFEQLFKKFRATFWKILSNL